MCQFASFFHNPINSDVVVSVLDSHGETEKNLKLNNQVWREGHYLPNGEVVLRLCTDDKVDTIEYKSAFVSRFPTFISFLNWAFLEMKLINGVYNGSLSLGGLTSAKDLILPKTIGGYLDLSGLTSAKDLILPKTIGGSLYLRDSVRAELNQKG